MKYFIAILQAESRSEFNTTQYALCMKALTGFEPLNPPAGGTFVAHHMVFNAEYMKEMLELMNKHTQSGIISSSFISTTLCFNHVLTADLPWPRLIMAQSRQFYRFSEYKTYATFMLHRHPEEFHHHALSHFGEGGMRFREANSIVAEMLRSCAVSRGGLSYEQVTSFMIERWQQLSEGNEKLQPHIKPAYVQLDHVYGLDPDVVEEATSLLLDDKGGGKRRNLHLSPMNLQASNRCWLSNEGKKRLFFGDDRAGGPLERPLTGECSDSDKDTQADCSCSAATSRSASTVLDDPLSESPPRSPSLSTLDPVPDSLDLEAAAALMDRLPEAADIESRTVPAHSVSASPSLSRFRKKRGPRQPDASIFPRLQRR